MDSDFAVPARLIEVPRPGDRTVVEAKQGLMAPVVWLATVPVAATVAAIAHRAIRISRLTDDVVSKPYSVAADSAEDCLTPSWPRSVYRVVRYAVDRIIAAVLLTILSPLMAVIAVAIRVDSEGPALFTQWRVGASGKPFQILKFRTLRVGAPAYSLKLQDHAPIVTKVGRVLRRTGLDEMPQLWNVVRGDMALIGPRPEQLQLIDLYEPWQRTRESIRPGITGWWQIHHRDGVPMHNNIEKDIYYIRHQGPWLDLLIIVGTAVVLFAGLLTTVKPLGRFFGSPTAELPTKPAENP